MKIAVISRKSEAEEIIRQLLWPWEATFTNSDNADVLIVHGEKPQENMPTIVVPSETAGFVEWLDDKRVNVSIRTGTRISVTVTPRTVLSMVPRIQYYFSGSTESVQLADQPQMIKLYKDMVILSIDIIEEYERIVNETLNPKPSALYNLLTSLPIPYGVAPRRLRNLVMRCNDSQVGLNLDDKLSLDVLRFLLYEAVEETTSQKLVKKKWNGKDCACAVTHDIETLHGLKMAERIKKIEEKYNVSSAWYIPSKRYALKPEIVRTLANFGEVGAHDTKHDGKLRNLSKRELAKRVSEVKRTLEDLAGHAVTGFRTPLLQQNYTVLKGLKDAGYWYDSSVPTWEPKHPLTMCPYGLGTTFPMVFDGMLEIPISVVQDHQLLHVLGLNKEETIAEWFSMRALIKELGGVAVFLAHPEYELFDKPNFETYEEFLHTITCDPNAWLTTPERLTEAMQKATVQEISSLTK